MLNDAVGFSEIYIVCSQIRVYPHLKSLKIKVMPKTKNYNGMTCSLNQEIYLRRFLDDGEISIDNNAG